MSHQQTVQTGEAPQLVVQEVNGNLLVRPGGQNEVIVRASPQNLTLNQTDDRVIIRCTSDCAIYAPAQATVEIESVSGNVSVNGILGAFSLTRVDGNLALRDTGAVTLSTVAGDLAITHSQGGVNIQTVKGNAALRHTAETVRIGEVKGDLRLRHMPDGVKIGQVKGNFEVENSGALTVESVSGDLRARRVSGDLAAGQVRGDLVAHHVQGSLQANVKGDLDLAAVDGDVRAEATGDGTVRGAILPGTSHQVQTKGDLFYYIPRDTDAILRLQSDTEIEVTDLDGDPVTTSGVYEVTLGTGSATLELSARGYLQVSGREQDTPDDRGFSADFEFGHEFGIRAAELAEQIAAQVEGQMETLAQQLDERLAHLGSSDEIATRVQQQVQNAMRRAEEKMSETLKNLESRSRGSDRRRTRVRRRERRHHHGWQPPQPPVPPQPPRQEPVDEEERMLILRMVEEGKLSVDQAEELLAALKG